MKRIIVKDNANATPAIQIITIWAIGIILLMKAKLLNSFFVSKFTSASYIWFENKNLISSISYYTFTRWIENLEKNFSFWSFE